jgi:fibronectin type 3 domain-containing protein
VYAYTVVAFDGAGNESGQATSSQTQTQGVAIPTGLAATDGTGSIELTWQAVDDDALIGYNIYRSARSDLPFTRIEGADGTSFTTGQTSYIDSGFTAGQLFFYKVSAVTSQTESEQSVFVSAEARTDDVSPATPANVVAIADAAQARVTLSWSGSTADEDGGVLTGLASYIVFRSKNGVSSLAAVDTVTAPETVFDDTGLDGATTYWYAVAALDPTGNVSPRSGAVSATTQGIDTPSGLAATAGIRTITLSWNASGEEDLLGYNVYRSANSDQGYERLTGSEGSTFTTGQTTFTDSGLTGGAVFFYRVSALVPEGESGLSAFDGVSVLTDTRAPAAPAFLDGDPVEDDPEVLNITWQAPTTDSGGETLTGVSDYLIYRADSAEGPFTQVGSSTTTSFQDTALAATTTYFYQVEAQDQEGNTSPRSSTLSLATSGVASPTNVTLSSTTPSASDESPVVTISWTASTSIGILRYEVQRTTVAGSTDDADFEDIVPNAITTTREDSTGTRGVVYYYRVRAVDSELRVSEWTALIAVSVSL